MAVASVDRRAAAAGTPPARAGHVFPPAAVVVEAHRGRRLLEDQRAGDEQSGIRVGIRSRVERPLGERHVPGCAHETAELGRGHGALVDPERLDLDATDRSLLGIEPLVAHREAAAGDEHHPRGGGRTRGGSVAHALESRTGSPPSRTDRPTAIAARRDAIRSPCVATRRDSDEPRGACVAEPGAVERKILPIPDRPYDGPLPLDARDPEATFAAIEPLRPPAEAPNVLVVLLDDVGYAQLGCYGSDIATPCFDSLAAAGHRYNRFHTTAMCSPTRASLLTGRNHHRIGNGKIAELANDWDGYSGHIPSCT